MSVKKHRAIRLPANPPKQIPQIVKELVKAMNQQQTDVRSFAASQKISFSKVYNWIAGKAQPKRNSTDIILRYFRKIKYNYVPLPEKNNAANTGTEHSHRITPSIAAAVNDMKKMMKKQSEQIRFLQELVHKLSENVDGISAVVKGIRTRKKEM